MAGAEKVLLVTGASRGIGASIARLGGRSYKVVVNYSESREAAEDVVAAIGKAGGEAVSIKADMGSEAEIVSLFETIDKTFGRLDALVNNAGVVDLKARVDEMSLARMERMWRVNLTAPFLCSREAVKRMSSLYGGVGGAIVNISSVAARLGGAGQYVDYAAAKAAIDALTIGLAREVAGEGIRVNAVRPGIVATDIHASGGQPNRVAEMRDSVPLKREGFPDEIAEAALWLLSDAASYATGAILDVTGGR